MSGVMAPGPVTAATLAAGTRRGDAGVWIAVGHGVVEFPLMGLILAGASSWFGSAAFRTGTGLAGGAMLVMMAGLMLWGPRRSAAAEPVRIGRPVWTGILLTGGNPYFLLWWATVGLGLSTQAMALGAMAFVLFAVVHWVCDLAWLTALSLASRKGITLMGPRAQRVVTMICAAAMAVFGVWFLYDAVRTVWG